MSKVQIEIPDDRWFRGSWNFRPEDKQLCVIVISNNDNPIRITQYRDDIFYDIRDILWHDCISEVFNFERIDRWKPLGLPEDVNERILAEIEKWFEEDK